MSDPDCPRCYAVANPVATFLALLTFDAEAARSPKAQLAATLYLDGRNRELAEWLIQGAKVYPPPDAGMPARLRVEKPHLVAVWDHIWRSVPADAWTIPADVLLDALHDAVAFPGLPEKKPARKRKPKPRAWERELKIETDRPPNRAA